MTDVDAAPAGQGPAPPLGERRDPGRGRPVLWLVAALVVLGVAGAGVAASNVEPLRAGSGTYDVRAESIELIRVAAPLQRDLYLAPFVEGERVTLRFPLLNDSFFPVRVLEVFPEDRVLGCGWRPDRVEASASSTDDHRPFEPVTLSPGEHLDLAVSGVLDCGGRVGANEGMTSYDTVPIRWRAAGILPRTSDVDPGYLFAWSDEPDTFLDDLVETRPPRSDG